MYQDLLHRAGVSSGHNGNHRGGNRDGSVKSRKQYRNLALLLAFSNDMENGHGGFTAN
jgi:hypothetical protein